MVREHLLSERMRKEPFLLPHICDLVTVMSRGLSAAATRSSHHAHVSCCPVAIPAVTSLAFSQMTGWENLPFCRAPSGADAPGVPGAVSASPATPHPAMVGQIIVSKLLLEEKFIPYSLNPSFPNPLWRRPVVVPTWTNASEAS